MPERSIEKYVVEGHGTRWVVWADETPTRAHIVFDPVPTPDRTPLTEREQDIIEGVLFLAADTALARWNRSVHVTYPIGPYPDSIIVTCDPQSASSFEMMVLRVVTASQAP